MDINSECIKSCLLRVDSKTQPILIKFVSIDSVRSVVS